MPVTDRTGHIAAQRLVELLGDVLGGVDETAEDDGVAALRENRLTSLTRAVTLRSALALNFCASARNHESTFGRGLTRIRRSARRGVGCLDGLVVGLIENHGAPDDVGLVGRSAAAEAARVRRVWAAARGDDASARSNASADHQFTRLVSSPSSVWDRFPHSPGPCRRAPYVPVTARMRLPW